MEIQSFKAPCGTVIIPGTRTKLRLICECDIAEWPELKPFDAAIPGNSITYDGDFVLKPGAKFAEVEIIADTGNVKHEGVGSKGGRNFTNSFDFKLMKTTGSDEWAEMHANGCFVGLITEKTGKVRVFGGKEMPAWIESSTGDGGTGNETAAEWTFQIKDNTGVVTRVYEGAIDVSSLDPEITSALTASGTTSAAFNYSIAATNSPTSFGASGLPAGLTLAPTTGVISGTPTLAGVYNVTITATNAEGSQSKSLVITIA